MVLLEDLLLMVVVEVDIRAQVMLPRLLTVEMEELE